MPAKGPSTPAKIPGRHRPPEPVPLPKLTQLMQQEAGLLGLLDALCMHLHAHAAGQGDDHPNDRDVVLIQRQPGNEALVDLQPLHRQALEPQQR